MYDLLRLILLLESLHVVVDCRLIDLRQVALIGWVLLLLLMKDATVDPSVILLQASATGALRGLLSLVLVGFEAFTTVCHAAACQVCIPADELLVKVGRILFFLFSLC